MKTSTRQRRWLALTLAIGVAVLGLSIAQRDSHAAGATATASAAKNVQIKGFAFNPATLKVGRGARVAFANASDVPHTATSGSFDTKRIAPGQSAAVKFNKRGTFAYHCKIHPFMKGKIVVE